MHNLPTRRRFPLARAFLPAAAGSALEITSNDVKSTEHARLVDTHQQGLCAASDLQCDDAVAFLIMGSLLAQTTFVRQVYVRHGKRIYTLLPEEGLQGFKGARSDR